MVARDLHALDVRVAGGHRVEAGPPVGGLDMGLGGPAAALTVAGPLIALSLPLLLTVRIRPLVASDAERMKPGTARRDLIDVRTVVCGHTHMPFVRLAHGRLVINPGSIGMSYGRAGAHWALLGPGVELRTTDFDIEAGISRVAQDSSYPGITEWADYFLHARATDADALEAFAPRDGRDHTQ
ncbi:hypothetical protein SUDANB58_04675 [Streptomyces sp. enrichment culture]